MEITRVLHPWVYYDDDEDAMICTKCAKFYGAGTLQNSFISGCKNFKTSALKDHEVSKSHISALATLSNREPASSAAVAGSTAGKALLALKSAERSRLESMVRNAHYIAKMNRPLTDFTSLVVLDRAKGLDTANTYKNNRAALGFIEAIAAQEKSRIVQSVKEAPFFSFIMDGSSDLTGDEQETIYIRFTKNGVPSMKFLSIDSPKSTCAADLYDHVNHVFINSQIDSEIFKGKMVGMGCDGASNMLGSKSGLASRLQSDNPELVTVHCLCHRLELAMKDVTKVHCKKLYDRVMTVMIGLHYFYKKSHKNKKGLQRAWDTLKIQVILSAQGWQTEVILSAQGWQTEVILSAQGWQTEVQQAQIKSAIDIKYTSSD
ncbi:zinc finger protein 862-like [Lingula anatina]|uniref:Zinc finger protein 862-like n=1 Tax=Lingula anatina TaxID=7574 RepID=A0A2R2MRI8_LINAN|nr:zinc finger protein 862-like [Lingula anatina]|eukprot:XP_023932869.1 zinc finger protein 862-like [Lingula anatina]